MKNVLYQTVYKNDVRAHYSPVTSLFISFYLFLILTRPEFVQFLLTVLRDLPLQLAPPF